MTGAAVAAGRPLETGWLPDTPVGDNLIRRFTRAQADVDAAIARAAGGRTVESAGAGIADTGGPVALFNQATLFRPLAGLTDPLLDGIESFFARDPGRPASLLSAWPTPDLSRRGWRLTGHPAFVVRPPQPRPPAPAAGTDGVELEPVASPGQAALAEHLLVEGFPVDEAKGAPGGSVFPAAVVDGPLRLRIGSVDGRPVAMAGGYVGAGVVNLFVAATLPQGRRRGVWRELVWARVGDAPELPAVAFTSDDSRPGFERMGFLTVTRFTLWQRAG